MSQNEVVAQLMVLLSKGALGASVEPAAVEARLRLLGAMAAPGSAIASAADELMRDWQLARARGMASVAIH